MTFERPVVEDQRIPDAARAKWSLELCKEGFVPLPKMLLRTLSSVMKDDAYERLQVLLAIADFIRPNGVAPPSYEFLAFNAGLPVEVFKNHLEHLKEIGLVEADGTEDYILRYSIAGTKISIKRYCSPEGQAEIDRKYKMLTDDGDDTPF